MKVITNNQNRLRKTWQAMAFITLMIFAGACKKDAEPYVRVKNNFTEALKEVKLDAISFGRVEKGGVTDYKYVFPGNFPVTVTTESGLTASGTANLTGGSGRENWTLVISKQGQVYGTQEE